MEIKKNKNVNLETKKGNLFLFGLLVSAGSLLMAFEWSSYDLSYTLPETEIGQLMEYEPAVELLETVQPQPKTVINQPIETDYELDETPEELPQDPITEVTEAPQDNLPAIDSVPNFGRSETTPVIEDIVGVAQVMPEYPGGLKILYEDLSKKLKGNPTGTSGKVYVEFVVEKDGSISNVKVIRGLNHLLDEQSIEAVKSLKKWKPGEQNYHKVRVKMVLPINYIIQS